MNREQMTPKEAVEIAKEIRFPLYSRVNNPQEVELYQKRWDALQVIICLADALLNAGEVFGEPLGKADENIPDDKEEAYRLGSKDTRSEDTAILAKKMMTIEEKINRMPIDNNSKRDILKVLREGRYFDV